MVDQTASIGAPPCPKTCGSKSCKGRLKLSGNTTGKICPGIAEKQCTAIVAKSLLDRTLANHWLKFGYGDKVWLREKTKSGTDLARKSHLEHGGENFSFVG